VNYLWTEETALSVQRTGDVMLSKYHAKVFFFYKNKIFFKKARKKKTKKKKSRTEEHSLPQGLLHTAQKG